MRSVRFAEVAAAEPTQTGAIGVADAAWRPHNAIPTEDEIRALAYTLWQANPQSDSTANWLEAERILTNKRN